VQSELGKQSTASKKAQKPPTTPPIYPAQLLATLLKERPLKTPRTTHSLVIGDSRNMGEVPDGSVHLVVTSPPYPMIELWDDLFLQMGCETFGAMHSYLAGVWKECFRVLVDGGIACINIGDALRKIDGTFQLFPNHVKVTEACERLGFNSLPYILWKKPTRKPNAFLGSGFIPPNAYVCLDCEFILIFRKGQPRAFPPKDLYRYASHYTKAERDAWFTQIWAMPGVRQETGQLDRRAAAFPEQIAYRLIRMFSVMGDTVLDPFLGTGTTMKVAMELDRNSIGYEIDERLLPTIESRLRPPRPRKQPQRSKLHQVEKAVRIIRRTDKL
jgi:DNA modification methylase